ncbi:uncharacterized protein LOC111374707 [Olea europaea var. sylvestris]|uniref:uncharacterized protein LOC111374707 n=1 Tax=Olea europaea var. sylvestris TaxID=158386 RepID=UPI000C1D68A1|nr:uncharacterized protein LOC111374707 [Olea europaea var. sylvestris]
MPRGTTKRRIIRIKSQFLRAVQASTLKAKVEAQRETIPLVNTVAKWDIFHSNVERDLMQSVANAISLDMKLGCTNHMTYDRTLFKELKPTGITKVRIENGGYIPAKGRGTIAITTSSGTKTISDVLYVPDIDQNLLIVGQLIERGFKVSFENWYCRIQDAAGQEILRVKMRGKSFSFDPTEEEYRACSTKASIIEIWHKRLRHCYLQRMLKMKKNDMIRGLPTLVDHLPNCHACQFGKQDRKLFPKSSWRASQKLQLVHADVGGPRRTPSLKSEVVGVFWKFEKMVENQSGCKIQVLRSNNGKEYTSAEFNLFCDEAGIEHQLIAPYTPEQNGVNERRNRYVMEMARCMLHEKELPKRFWAEVANTAVFLQNRLPSKAIKDKTPFEAWFGYIPSLSFLKVFGCVCFAQIPGVKRDKLDKKAIPGIFWHNELEDDPPIRGTRPLSDIYHRCNVALCEPAGHEEALKDLKWKKAMEEEMSMIHKNRTWELVNKPEGRKVIGVKWVYKTKLNADNSINKHKARLVIKGYAQIFSVDYSDTLAPIARLDTIRMLLTLAAQKGWKVFQLDVKLAFLNGVLQKEIYLEQPDGFVVQGEEDKNGSYVLIVSFYVDDLLVTGNNAQMVAEFKQEMMQVFEMTDSELMTYFLGMEVKQSQNEVFICQKKYVKEILKKFQIEECKASNTPMGQKEKLSKDDGADKVDESYYRSLIGCLMYLTATRPDILEVHLRAAKRILRFIKGTVDCGVK